jgi:hypothetical protein
VTPAFSEVSEILHFSVNSEKNKYLSCFSRQLCDIRPWLKCLRHSGDPGGPVLPAGQAVHTEPQPRLLCFSVSFHLEGILLSAAGETLLLGTGAKTIPSLGSGPGKRKG